MSGLSLSLAFRGPRACGGRGGGRFGLEKVAERMPAGRPDLTLPTWISDSKGRAHGGRYAPVAAPNSHSCCPAPC